jgi:hypothetical protein
MVDKVRHFIKTEITSNNPGLPLFHIDFDASILWNMAQRLRMKNADLAEPMMDRMVTPIRLGYP